LAVGALLESLRQQIGGMPLNVVIHGWGSRPSRRFLDALLPSLRKDDSLWLCGAAPSAPAPAPPLERLVVLDVRNDSDQRLYRSLVYDVAFFAAAREDETELAALLRQRARVVVVDPQGAHQKAVVAAATAAQLSTFAWREPAGILEEQPGAGGPATAAAKSSAGPDFAVVGVALKSATEYLEQEKDRRQRLRSVFETLKRRHPGASDLDESLVREADRSGWPEWAIECLPRLYLPLPGSGAGGQRALVWRYILDCLPESLRYDTNGELCGGQVRDITMPADTVVEVERIVPVFERHRCDNPYPSKRSTLGVVITSIIECQIHAANAPIRNELKSVVIGLAKRKELKDLAEPLKSLREHELRPGIMRVAKAVNWPYNTATALINSVEAFGVWSEA